MSGNVAVLRDRIGHWVFVDSDNSSNNSHYSVFDIKGQNLLRKGTLEIDQSTLIKYLQDTLGYKLERGLV
jgi:hypothetical protein